jgi:hypothetical protein
MRCPLASTPPRTCCTTAQLVARDLHPKWKWRWEMRWKRPNSTQTNLGHRPTRRRDDDCVSRGWCLAGGIDHQILDHRFA